jgi:hypothetical protein
MATLRMVEAEIDKLHSASSIARMIEERWEMFQSPVVQALEVVESIGVDHMKDVLTASSGLARVVDEVARRGLTQMAHAQEVALAASNIGQTLAVIEEQQRRFGLELAETMPRIDGLGISDQIAQKMAQLSAFALPRFEFAETLATFRGFMDRQLAELEPEDREDWRPFAEAVKQVAGEIVASSERRPILTDRQRDILVLLALGLMTIFFMASTTPEEARRGLLEWLIWLLSRP